MIENCFRSETVDLKKVVYFIYKIEHHHNFGLLKKRESKGYKKRTETALNFHLMPFFLFVQELTDGARAVQREKNNA